jgi:hypothetical protein
VQSLLSAKIWFDAERKTQPMDVLRHDAKFCLRICLECGSIESFMNDKETNELMRAAGELETPLGE